MVTRQYKMKLVLKIAFCIFFLMVLCAYADEKHDLLKSASLDVKIVQTIKNDFALNYVVRSIIYPEDTDTIFLTLRGGGISTYDISDPAHPKFLTHWDEKISRHVEGQDRTENLLVVTDISRGGLFLFDISDPSHLDQLSYLNIEGVDNMLHCRISQADEKMYAFFTGGFNFKTGELSDLLIAVDISDPQAPFFVSKINTGIQGTEGITIKNGYAFIGGIGSDRFSVIDVSNPLEMTVVQVLERPHYCQ